MKDNFTTTLNDYLHLRTGTVSGNQLVRSPQTVDLPWLRYRGIPFHLKKDHGKTVYVAVKRGIDITVSLAVIVAALPMIAVIIALIKATSPGPVLFRHRRIGRDGVEFDCFKFRTMVADADQRLKTDPELRARFEQKFKLDDDPRITRVGRFLRSTSLDELPQLIQVLQGKMTLIGPRPIVRGEIEKYSIYAGKLFSVTPGLSGLWQTCGRSSTTYSERVVLDMYYIDNRSLRLELQLLMLTVVTVLKKSGAC